MNTENQFFFHQRGNETEHYDLSCNLVFQSSIFTTNVVQIGIDIKVVPSTYQRIQRVGTIFLRDYVKTVAGQDSFTLRTSPWYYRKVWNLYPSWCKNLPRSTAKNFYPRSKALLIKNASYGYIIPSIVAIFIERELSRFPCLTQARHLRWLASSDRILDTMGVLWKEQRVKQTFMQQVVREE